MSQAWGQATPGRVQLSPSPAGTPYPRTPAGCAPSPQSPVGGDARWHWGSSTRLQRQGPGAVSRGSSSCPAQRRPCSHVPLTRPPHIGVQPPLRASLSPELWGSRHRVPALRRMSSSTGCFLLQQRPRCSCCYFCTATAPLRLREGAALTAGRAAPCAGDRPHRCACSWWHPAGTLLTPHPIHSALQPASQGLQRSQTCVAHPRPPAGAPWLCWLLAAPRPSASHRPFLLSARGPCTVPGPSPVRPPAGPRPPTGQPRGSLADPPPRSTGAWETAPPERGRGTEQGGREWRKEKFLMVLQGG